MLGNLRSGHRLVGTVQPSTLRDRQVVIAIAGPASGAPAAAATTTRQPAACWPLAVYSEVNIFIEVPQGVRAKQLNVSIQSQSLNVGIKELPPYLDVRRRP